MQPGAQASAAARNSSGRSSSSAPCRGNSRWPTSRSRPWSAPPVSPSSSAIAWPPCWPPTTPRSWAHAAGQHPRRRVGGGIPCHHPGDRRRLSPPARSGRRGGRLRADQLPSPPRADEDELAGDIPFRQAARRRPRPVGYPRAGPRPGRRGQAPDAADGHDALRQKPLRRRVQRHLCRSARRRRCRSLLRVRKYRNPARTGRRPAPAAGALPGSFRSAVSAGRRR